ncbi:hypothetical protein [Hahella ganghwensis]|uniref:hypothetical protein n=1 Tax=Hahella ganghwensis TaxID=286420 RepID=UPI00037443E2|nr:hypothetical protein [Hahella ganghwensis]
MNIWIFSAGVIAFFTALVHIIAGQIDPVKPFLHSELAEVPKATLLSCWHMVSLVLVLSSVVLLYAGWVDASDLGVLVFALSSAYVGFAAVFIGVGWYFFGYRTLIRLPQWVLLIPIGCWGAWER